MGSDHHGGKVLKKFSKFTMRERNNLNAGRSYSLAREAGEGRGEGSELFWTPSPSPSPPQNCGGEGNYCARSK
jgi:hypothetical protein